MWGRRLRRRGSFRCVGRGEASLAPTRTKALDAPPSPVRLRDDLDVGRPRLDDALVRELVLRVRRPRPALHLPLLVRRDVDELERAVGLDLAPAELDAGLGREPQVAVLAR